MLTALFDEQVVFFGGKGGVGKTTCSAAFALAASRRGQRALLVSTDPAHSTADIFERPIGSSECEIAPGLHALEIDAEGEARRYVDQVKLDIQKMFSANVIRQAHRQIDAAAASPGLTEVALLTQRSEMALTEVYTPQGINVGINLGRPAGAGIADHVHVHLVPRWTGDTNFMSVVGNVRVLPEEVHQSAERLRPVFDQLAR